jgi:hypothetical protein
MLQVFHLNVSKVDRMLHILNETQLASTAAGRRLAGADSPCVRSSSAGDIQTAQARVGARNEEAQETGCMETVQEARASGRLVRPDTRALANMFVFKSIFL